MPSPATGFVAWGQLIGAIGQAIPQPIAKELVQQAWRSICDSRRWSFLRARGYLILPGALTGNVTFTRGSASAVADSTLATSIESPSVDRLVDIGKMAVRDTNSPRSAIYQIRGYDSTINTLTLDSPYRGLSGLKSITIFRQYFTPPISDMEGNVESANFRNFTSIVDVDNESWRVSLDNSADWLDAVDPGRHRTGTPSYLVQAPYDALGSTIASTGTPLFELWPHYIGTEEKQYECRFIRQFLPLSDNPGDLTNVLPGAIPMKYLMAQSKLQAYEWALINAGDYPKFKGINFIQGIQIAAAERDEEFLKARASDEERYPEYLDTGRVNVLTGYNQNTGPIPGLFRF